MYAPLIALKTTLNWAYEDNKYKPMVHPGHGQCPKVVGVIADRTFMNGPRGSCSLLTHRVREQNVKQDSSRPLIKIQIILLLAPGARRYQGSPAPRLPS